MTEEIERNDDVIVQLPIDLLASLAQSAVEVGNDVLATIMLLERQWAVIYKKKAESGVMVYDCRGFPAHDVLAGWLEKNHNEPDVEIVAILKNGKPRKFKMEVKARFR
jgi:hypothetical protein